MTLATATINQEAPETHALGSASLPGSTELTVVSRYPERFPLTLLAQVVNKHGRTEWVGSLPHIFEGRASNGDVKLHTNGSPVEYAFGVTYCGRKRVQAAGGFSMEEARIKIALSDPTDVRHILLICITEPDRHNRLSSFARTSQNTYVIVGNNDVTTMADEGLVLNRQFGERDTSDWYVPGILRINDQAGVTANTNAIWREVRGLWRTQGPLALPNLDQFGNFMLPSLTRR